MFFKPVDNSSGSNKEIQNDVDEYNDQRPYPPQEQKEFQMLSLNQSSLGQTLLDICWCHERTKHQKDLPPIERIMVESKWTDSILKLLSIGNSTVMRSIQYRLVEQTPEDKEAEV
jgi:hypothetical protein